MDKKENSGMLLNREENEVETKLYTRRWIMLVMNMIVILLNGATYSAFAPLADMFREVYDVPIIAININAILMVFLYIPSNFLIANFMFKKFGLYITYATGCILNSLCLWMRVGIAKNFYIAMIGGLFYGIAQPLILNANAEFASNWFSTDERTLATTLGALMGGVGGGVGYALYLPFVTPRKNIPDDEKEIVKGEFFRFALGVAVLFTVLYALTLLIFREKPPLPPTKSAAKIAKDETPCDSMSTLSKNWHYVYVLGAFTFIYGSMNTFSQEAAIIIGPFGFTSGDTTVIGLLFSGCGLVGAFITAKYIGSTKRYRKGLIMVCLFSTICCIILTAVLMLENKLLLYIASSMLGFSIIPIFAAAIDFCCEVSYPVTESTSTGAMFAASQLFCVIFIIVTSFIFTDSVDPYKKRWEATVVCLLISSTLALGYLCSAFAVEDLRKTKRDKEKLEIKM